MSETERNEKAAPTPSVNSDEMLVPPTVSGLRALLGEAVVEGIRVMHDTKDDFHRLYAKHGRTVPVEETLGMGKLVSDRIRRIEQWVAASFPQHWAEGSPARPVLEELVYQSFMAGMRSCATAAELGRARMGQEQYFGGTLPADPQWLAIMLNIFLEATLPGIQRQGVPIMGTAQFLEERGLAGR